MQRYVLERILYRLTRSKFSDEFVLKGAMLQAVWLESPFRATRDLDLHARGEEDAARAYKAFEVILATKVDDDGVTFDAKDLTAEPIRENVSYGGIRLTTTARLGGARVPVVIDIGFGDAITPKPELAEYTSLLDLPKPRLLVYPRETVVAEKFEAMISLGLTNSRMKDFHDVAVLASTFEFNGYSLVKAFTATFMRRGTPLPKEAPPALTDAFTKRPETVALWKAFVTRESILKEYSDLDTVVRLLRSFLLQPAATATAQTDFPLHWPPGGPWAK
ncbi:MAG TPA: nucleotidyl transferase AbiEii/AbiGii toxin family protein [Rhizomicrobium sp.]|jgi:hypothetical protein|nr:nucleotidyl transferase AbiEii/AbiGii toxin family protein [Rhizomicrobium sp.]